jgi:hypothetical protein
MTTYEPAFEPTTLPESLTLEEAQSRAAQLLEETEEIDIQVADGSRMHGMSATDYNQWRKRALHAKRIKMQQYRDLKQYIKAENIRIMEEQQAAKAKRLTRGQRRQQHDEIIAQGLQVIAEQGVEGVLRALHLQIKALHRQSGIPYTDDETIVLDMAQELFENTTIRLVPASRRG